MKYHYISVNLAGFCFEGHICDQLIKTCHVHTTTEFIFITPAYRFTQWLFISSVSNVNIKWSAFLEGILLTPLRLE